MTNIFENNTAEKESLEKLKITIDAAIRDINPRIKLGVVGAEVVVRPSGEDIISRMNLVKKDILQNYTSDSVKEAAPISSVSDTYKSIGKDPSRYRGSAEALVRRIFAGKDLYNINNIVDINNIVSLSTLHPVGSYDLDKIQGPVFFTIGKKVDSYKGIGKDIVNTEDLPVFKDSVGVYGSPTSDSERAMIKDQTRRVMMVIISFNGEGVEDGIKQIKDMLVKYAGARILGEGVII